MPGSRVACFPPKLHIGRDSPVAALRGTSSRTLFYQKSILSTPNLLIYLDLRGNLIYAESPPYGVRLGV